jgi:alpha-D-ribose 1-methylphosphonate 5-triphosphate synthase subunit PhnL
MESKLSLPEKAQPVREGDDGHWLECDLEHAEAFQVRDVLRERLGWEAREKYYVTRLGALEKVVEPMMKLIGELESSVLGWEAREKALKQKIKEAARELQAINLNPHDGSETCKCSVCLVYRELLGLSK